MKHETGSDMQKVHTRTAVLSPYNKGMLCVASVQFYSLF